MKRLSNASLGLLPGTVIVPRYERSAITPGIVHLGLGNFHRAHQAIYTDDCLNRGERNWGIAAVSLRRPDMRNALFPQDGLYTFAARQNEEEHLRVVGALHSITVAHESPAAVMALLTSPATRIVSLTVTEKGYTANLASATLEITHPDIQHDLTNTGPPRSVLGWLHQAVTSRRAAGVEPFSVLSCDNLPQNGKLLKSLLTQFAEAKGSGLSLYLQNELACPSSMVDRIVPETTDEMRHSISNKLGVEDAWPVAAEAFTQWVVEDAFPQGRPRWEESGVEFVKDVTPFEHMKLRLLNGSHSTIAAIGRVAGFATVAEAIAHPAVRAFVEAYWQEVAPTLSPQIDVKAYTRRLLSRYENTSLNHKLAQIATDASQKLPQRIIAPLGELLVRGQMPRAMIMAVAAWIASCAAVDENGQALQLNDPAFAAWAQRPDQNSIPAAEVARTFVSFAKVFGTALPAHQAFVGALADALILARRHGILEALPRN